MGWVHLTDNNLAIDSAEVIRPTRLVRRGDGAKVLWSDYITDAELNGCGWFLVVEPTRPTITAAETFEPDTIALVAGTPTRRYHARPKTVAELAADTAQANSTTVSNPTNIATEIANLKTFLSDIDVQAVLDNPNATPLPTATLNRALKSIVRQLRRDANFDVRLARYVFGQLHPELLQDISDTSGA
jgi:hypothetical protein